MASADDREDEVERRRLAAVRRYEILDTPPDGAFDRIAAVAARIFSVPIGIVSIVDSDRIWFKAHHGLPDVAEVDRSPGLCASAVLQDDPWVVTHADVDPRALTNPLVAGDFGLKFYVGVPLTTPDGHKLGTLCVLDTESHEVSDDQIQTLEDLAEVIVDELEVRIASRKTVGLESRLRREAEQLAIALQASLLPPRPPDIPGMELASRYIPGDRNAQIGGDFFDVFRLASNDWGIVVGDACGKGPRAAGVAALARWSVRASAVHHFDPSAVLSDLNTVLLAEGDGDDDRFCTVAFARLELDACGAWVTVSSAGHPLPMLVRATGVVEERGRPGVPVGLFDSATSIDDRIGLGPGDSLVLYTDGITEARTTDGAQFGQDRLRQCLVRWAGRSADEIATNILGEARAFADGIRDDVAVIVLRVPDDLGADPVVRVATATGVPVAQLHLPSYAHGEPRPPDTTG